MKKKRLLILCAVLLLVGLVGLLVRQDFQTRFYIGLANMASSLNECQKSMQKDSWSDLPSGKDFLAGYESARNTYNKEMEYWRFDLEDNLPWKGAKPLPRQF